MLRIQRAYMQPVRPYMLQANQQPQLKKTVDISALVENFQGILNGADPGYTSLSYSGMAREGYILNATVRNCVDTINNGLNGLPVYLMQTIQTPRGQKTRHFGRHPDYLKKSVLSTEEQPDDHPLNKLLKNPNPRMNRREFLETVSGSLLLGGDGIIVPVNPKTREGPPLGLYPLRPDMVNVDEVLVNGIRRIMYTYQPSSDGQPLGKAETYWDNEVIHIKLLNPTNGLRGLGPITAARASTDRSNASEKWNYSLIKNSAKQSGILTTDSPIDPNQKEQIEKKRDAMIGMLNAGRPPIMTNGLKWQSISLSPFDMDWLAGDKNADEKIARAFRVPNQIVGIPGSQTFANYQEANRCLFETNIIPFGERILEKLTSLLAPRYGEGLELVVDTDNVPAMRESQNDKYNRANTAWWLNINQKLQMTGWETIGPKGDVMMVPMGLLPLDMATAAQSNGTSGDNTDGTDGGQKSIGAVTPFAPPGGY